QACRNPWRSATAVEATLGLMGHPRTTVPSQTPSASGVSRDPPHAAATEGFSGDPVKRKRKRATDIVRVRSGGSRRRHPQPRGNTKRSPIEWTPLIVAIIGAIATIVAALLDS